MSDLNKPIIMTAMLGKADFAWANGLRRAHYPPERNVVAAHCTLFHHLPPRLLPEIKRALIEITGSTAPPPAELQRLIHLGRGVAYQVHAPALLAMRMDLADRFHGLLSAQDQQTPRLHITVQNKVTPKEAKALLDRLAIDFESRPIAIRGFELHYYLDGPWQLIGQWPFRGAR